MQALRGIRTGMPSCKRRSTRSGTCTWSTQSRWQLQSARETISPRSATTSWTRRQFMPIAADQQRCKICLGQLNIVAVSVLSCKSEKCCRGPACCCLSCPRFKALSMSRCKLCRKAGSCRLKASLKRTVVSLQVALYVLAGALSPCNSP